MCLCVLHSVRLLPSISSFSFTVRHHTISSSHGAVKWAIGRRVVVFASSLDCCLVVTSFSLYPNISKGKKNKEMNCYDRILGIQMRATFHSKNIRRNCAHFNVFPVQQPTVIEQKLNSCDHTLWGHIQEKREKEITPVVWLPSHQYEWWLETESSKLWWLTMKPLV